MKFDLLLGFIPNVIFKLISHLSKINSQIDSLLSCFGNQYSRTTDVKKATQSNMGTIVCGGGSGVLCNIQRSNLCNFYIFRYFPTKAFRNHMDMCDSFSDIFCFWCLSFPVASDLFSISYLNSLCDDQLAPYVTQFFLILTF